MSDRPDVLAAALVELLRPVIAELVDDAVHRELAALDHQRDDERCYLTTAEYARRHKTTPEAVGARIRRGTLQAIRPPGSRGWLIPADGEGYDGRQ